MFQQLLSFVHVNCNDASDLLRNRFVKRTLSHYGQRICHVYARSLIEVVWTRIIIVQEMTPTLLKQEQELLMLDQQLLQDVQQQHQQQQQEQRLASVPNNNNSTVPQGSKTPAVSKTKPTAASSFYNRRRTKSHAGGFDFSKIGFISRTADDSDFEALMDALPTNNSTSVNSSSFSKHHGIVKTYQDALIACCANWIGFVLSKIFIIPQTLCQLLYTINQISMKQFPNAPESQRVKILSSVLFNYILIPISTVHIERVVGTSMHWMSMMHSKRSLLQFVCCYFFCCEKFKTNYNS